jgi:hypothetical protein
MMDAEAAIHRHFERAQSPIPDHCIVNKLRSVMLRPPVPTHSKLPQSFLKQAVYWQQIKSIQAVNVVT